MVLLPSSFQGNRTKALCFLSISKTVTEKQIRSLHIAWRRCFWMLACVQDGTQECIMLTNVAVTNSSVLYTVVGARAECSYLIRQGPGFFKTDNTYKSHRYQCYREREIRSLTFLFTITVYCCSHKYDLSLNMLQSLGNNMPRFYLNPLSLDSFPLKKIGDTLFSIGG